MSASLMQGSSSFALRGRSYPREETSNQERPARSARPWALAALAALLTAIAAWQLGSAAWIHAKAIVAQRLIAAGWDRERSGGSGRPWPWADTRPIARLTVPARGIALFVLAGASGRSLAFGPGHVDGTALPGTAGNSVIVAHRDTHFAFLRDLKQGDEIVVEDVRGKLARYRVREALVVDKQATRLLDAADSPQLTLITCWPFDAVRPGTPERYVVIADRTR